MYVSKELVQITRREIFISWYITPCNPLKVNDVSEEHFTSIIKVEEQATQETSVSSGGKQGAT
jgi:hypothetical protein